jgi:hypothetical protein
MRYQLSHTGVRTNVSEMMGLPTRAVYHHQSAVGCAVGSDDANHSRSEWSAVAIGSAADGDGERADRGSAANDAESHD